MSAEYHSALEASVERHFPGNNCINCMCHSTEDIYRLAPKSLIGDITAAPAKRKTDWMSHPTSIEGTKLADTTEE